MKNVNDKKNVLAKNSVLQNRHLLFFFLLLIPFLHSCTHENEDDILASAEIIENRFKHDTWRSPSDEQLNIVWNNMMRNVEYTDALNFLHRNGNFNWEETHLIKSRDQNFLLSIPTIIDTRVASILFVSLVDGKFTYLGVPLALIQIPTDELIKVLGLKNALLAITGYAAHQQHFGNYTNGAILKHLQNSLVRNAMYNIAPRGYCLMEFTIYTIDMTEGNSSLSDSQNFVFDIPEEEDVISSIIHGQQVEWNEEVFYFWAWCDDEEDQSQDGWNNNWQSNDDGVLGSDQYNNVANEDIPDWNYYGLDLFEGIHAGCLFYFDLPVGSAFSNLRTQLLASSCGEAAAYVIQHTLVNTVHGLCDQVDGGTFPTGDERIPRDETIELIQVILQGNEIFQMGQWICEHCSNANNNSACINQFSSCGTEDHAACVAYEIFGDCLGETAKVTPQLGLSFEEISQICNDDITSTPPICSTCSPAEEAGLQLAYAEALEQLECALDLLENNWDDQNVQDAVDTHFSGSIPYDLTFLQLLDIRKALLFQMKIVKSGLMGNQFFEIDTGCPSDAAANVDFPLGNQVIYICSPQFYSLPIEEAGESILHEAFHIHCEIYDWAYEYNPGYEYLSLLMQLTNADSYSEFIFELCN